MTLSKRSESMNQDDEAALLTRHRDLSADEPWRAIPAWEDVSAASFGDHLWQIRNSVTRPRELVDLLDGAVSDAFRADLLQGFALAPMAVRLTPYVVSLIDWSDPVADPIRRQFLPLGSEHEPDHPMGSLDALEEQRDAVAPGLTHRYPDKVLFLALDTCPVYCRYCTRSYSIGSDTDSVDKLSFRPSRERWEAAFAYIESHPAVEDVVVSGGDVYMLSASMLAHILDRLFAIPHVRRIRLATKGLAVMPQKILSDAAWTDVVVSGAQKARERGVQLAVHTHFNHPREISEVSREAVGRLFEAGIVVRNQSVLLRGVNDDLETMRGLVRRLSWINVQPYYVYVHDMVPGVETLRTTLKAAVELEKGLRGSTAGFMTPTFVCDAYGGGGKRDLHSYEIYDEQRGVALYRSPVVDPERAFYYFDPLRALTPHLRKAWGRPELRASMLAGLREEVGL